MTPNFTHKILNAEILPPDAAWDKIAAELDKLDGSGFIQKISEASIEPPSSVWQRVANALENPKPAKRILISRPWIKWAAAAAIGGLIIVGVYYFNNGNQSGLISSNGDKQSNSKDATAVPPSNANDASSSGTIATLDPNIRLAENSKLANKKNSIPGKGEQTKIPVRHAVIESAGMEKEPNVAPESESRISDNISSSSANLIPAPDYYVVTAPNGQRVRMSSKFSHAVTSLFGGDNVDYLWKSRFDSWKSKIMSNPSFIPTGGNFLDIAELKDLLKEQ
jgi:hypothetical protein